MLNMHESGDYGGMQFEGFQFSSGCVPPAFMPFLSKTNETDNSCEYPTTRNMITLHSVYRHYARVGTEKKSEDNVRKLLFSIA